MRMRMGDFIGARLLVSFEDGGKTYEQLCDIVEWHDWFNIENYDISIGVIREGGYSPDDYCKLDCKIFKCAQSIPGFEFLFSTSSWEELKNDRINLNITICQEGK